ncbi:MAG TPA: glycosyltransferase family 9 protein, partial [Candidatus Krumholzibacterium sp.]|nr:glycosyltransferase family 9 protein [Candidatus Krumholzibacterium sp.]
MRGNRTYKLIDRAAGVPLLLAVSAARHLRAGRRGVADRKLAPGDSVLVVKQSALGDTLLLLPVIKSIRDTIGPEGRIDMVVTPVNEAVASRCPWLDEVHLFHPSSVLRDPRGLLRLIGRLRRRGYDQALDLDQWLRSSALLAVMSGAMRVTGFRTPGQHRHFAYDRSVLQAKGIHESLLFAELARLAGVDAGRIEPYAGFLKRHGIFAGPGSSAPEARKIILFHPGCGSHGWQREWPVEKYARLGEMLVKSTGADIEVTGHGPHERGLIEDLARAASFIPVDHGSDLTFDGLAARVSGARLVVCGNTGVMHLATGLDVPVVAVHGPTDITKWGPVYGLAEEGSVSGKAVAVKSPIECSPCLFLG